MSVTSQPILSQQPTPTMSDAIALSESPNKHNQVLVSTVSSGEASSPDEIGSESSKGPTILTDTSSQSKPKSILDNPDEVLPHKASRSGSESGFKAALKATFLPPPTPGRQIKVEDGKRLGKTFRRIEPRPNDFEGGQVLDYDPRGRAATAGDGILPQEWIKPPTSSQDRRDSASESGYGSDKESSVGTLSELGETSDFSRSYTSEAGSAWGDSSERGRNPYSASNRVREASMASVASSSSGAAIKFAPLPVSGRLKRANSITIGVAARSHLLQSQGTAAPPRPLYTPQHVHGSQSWYTGAQPQAPPRYDDVIDVGEEIKKRASRAWKLIRGGGGSGSDSSSTKVKENADPVASDSRSDADQKGAADAALFKKPKKSFPKEGAPVADPETGELKMANGSNVNTTPKISQGQVSDKAKKTRAGETANGRVSGDQTPRRAASPTAQLRSMSISEEPEAEEAAAALEAAHAKNVAKSAHLGNGHHHHEFEDGPQHNTFHLADEHDAAHLDSGAATPRSGMQRRLSTGTFLRGLSIRGIQEDRRRSLLGLNQEGEEEMRDSGEAAERMTSGENNRHGIAVRTPAGKEEELGLEGYGHSRPLNSKT
ncbi:uncharacterized protein MEPE_04159 [Melanopsichium pennsylvanicum]|uniref:Uncharacterized protein n=2 Tax=Melanopsichium pennsylvanicum TaxID=63383 RepID=A0AAJ4XND5_9BASI|nr:hypothetical protein BN887_05156 [Melanopsichium pennsylvanicum 4]SNX85450.1 uncharacterized protein MEPE_04159 [Melanopsichium pennsylvanicum]